MNAPIIKEDFIKPIWFLGAKLIDGDMVNTPSLFNTELVRKAISHTRLIE